jgi:hypothetical protein
LKDELRTIYGIYLTPVLETGEGGGRFQAQVDGAAAAVVAVFRDLCTQFRATDQPHYTFTALHLTNWVCALLRYGDQTCLSYFLISFIYIL